MKTVSVRRSIVIAVTLIVAQSAHSALAGITGVTDSRVQGFFSTSNDAFHISDPLGLIWLGPLGPAGVAEPTSGIPGVPAAPAGGAAVAGVNGVNWVPFTYPFPRYYAGDDSGFNPNGSQTFTSTAIVGGFVVPASQSIGSAFVLVPQDSYLLQQPTAPGNAYTQLNFSIDYAVDALGLNAAVVPASYHVFGNIAPGGYADFGGRAQYWDVTGAPVLLGELNLSFFQKNLTAGNLPFDQLLTDNQIIAGMVGAGTLRITGDIFWEGDPMEIHVDFGQFSAPEPSSFLLTGIGVLGLGLFARRQRRRIAA